MTDEPYDRVELRVPKTSLARWRATAGAKNMSLSQWIRERCDEAAVGQEVVDLIAKRGRKR